MRITGPRGSGKTVLLTELGELAAQRGWRVVNVVSDEDICDSIMRQLRSPLRARSVTVGAMLPFVSATAELDMPAEDGTFRECLNRRCASSPSRMSVCSLRWMRPQNVDRDAMGTIASCVQLRAISE